MALAIFAGIAFFSIIFLYTRTADRWNWKRIIYIALAASFTIVAALILLLSWDSLFTPSIPNHKGYLTSFRDIKMGMKLSDLEFKYGKLDKQKPVEGSKFDLYQIGDDVGVYIGHADKRVGAIVIICSGGVKDQFNGIACDDPSEKLEKKFGNDLAVLCKIKESDDSERSLGSRSYDVAKNGTRYVLSKNKVIYIGIMEKEDFVADGKKWGGCDN